MSGASWLDDLESRLESTFEAFLRANPGQEALLQEQEARERQQRLRRQRLELQGQAELGRRRLLALAEEIRRWQERVERARQAGAEDLAGRAEAHIAGLMEQGRQRWQELGEVGRRFAAVEKELAELGSRGTPPAPSPQENLQDQLEGEWAAFESRQELEDLRRRMGR
jgi:hercynine metabolism protein